MTKEFYEDVDFTIVGIHSITGASTAEERLDAIEFLALCGYADGKEMVVRCFGGLGPKLEKSAGLDLLTVAVDHYTAKLIIPASAALQIRAAQAKVNQLLKEAVDEGRNSPFVENFSVTSLLDKLDNG
jgi:hypothetical protein